MNDQKKKELAERLAALGGDERRKLYKKAAAFRRAMQTSTKPGRRREDEDDADGDAWARRRKQDPLDIWVLKLLDMEEPVLEESSVGTRKAVVEWVGLKACRVRHGKDSIDCTLSGVIAREQQSLIAVGDEVLADLERKVVVRVLPRRSKLSRPDPDNRHLERVIVANVDVVVITVSVKTPPLHPRLIDRYLVAVQRGGALPLICVNKLDLVDSDERRHELQKLDPYVEMGAEVVPCSTETFEGIVPLKTRLEGLACAFVGHSGVGKSSLLNVIAPELNLATRSVSEGYGRGTHTTTNSSLYDLGGGTRLIDTPGIRSFGLFEEEDLAWYFPEFAPFAEKCKFRDCTHTHEPNCGVRAAVNMGSLSKARFDTYVRLLNP